MAELTIQIPDELAQCLEPLRSRLPELSTRAKLFTRSSDSKSLSSLGFS